MSDGLLAVIWLLVLASGIGGCVLLHRLGLPSTYARDLLHIGTGVWVLGWPLWDDRIAPMLLLGAAVAATALVPLAAHSSPAFDKLKHTFASGDERWTGLVLYTLSYLALTWVGLSGHPFAAAAGLLALSLGDGVGGAIGRRFGRHPFRAPGGKTKSLEGSASVALFAAIAVLVAAWRLDVAIGIAAVVALGALAAIAEAASPRGTDNLIVPAVVWGVAEAVT